FLPPERDPTKLFNNLFGNVKPGTGGSGGAAGAGGSQGLPTDVSNKLRRSVLDAVLADANRLKMTVGSVDAKRIDAHMQSIHDLELRIPDASAATGMAGMGAMSAMGGMGGKGSGTSTASCTAPAAPPMTLA